MGKIVSISNQKGGVGKTTTSINLAANLASIGKKVLIIDMDPQGNSGSGLGIEINTLVKTSYELLLGESSTNECIQRTNVSNLHIIPSNINLSGAEADLLVEDQREYRLKNAVSELRSEYDYILIDCPPSLGILTINALCAADSVMITLQTEYFALEGLTQLMKIISLVQNQLNPSLELEGVLLTMFDKRTNLANQVAEDVKSYFKDKVYTTIIPRNVKLSEAPSFGQTIMSYDPEGVGAQSYRSLALEVAGKS
ncbi:ParA family protein [Leptospira borgpetersenii]|uniref:ParA-like protein n=3 Tax=Leptospira borgpetersenii TaxID=174 RepID=Q04WD5_LEPBJ|nr:AAA family ATPase [Leptospira borgpetersenii]EMO63589.1 sporulation initiation inhibitor protein Soj [Leptospira borgpetersenii serovar Pomona str. 200901868]ABJ74785.1 ParA-like protein [Leptospira borgpetersenii serovar Hardjo-bovis str. JB197]ABJ80297.1 ParA-like protein [Leptospira borgpetersenii serovar Hardjo-bovis str. L550]AMX59771.1 sporulation initiation inhibitor Soj [Leptospira borgpetersenii serovar Hardjo]AMX62999.1 sporulation initiation inhibitor Soj [Leptospira borgpetersen